jgi:hypothetical protein
MELVGETWRRDESVAKQRSHRNLRDRNNATVQMTFVSHSYPPIHPWSYTLELVVSWLE